MVVRFISAFALQIAASAAEWLSIAGVSAAMEREVLSTNSASRAKRVVIIKPRDLIAKVGSSYGEIIDCLRLNKGGSFRSSLRHLLLPCDEDNRPFAEQPDVAA